MKRFCDIMIGHWFLKGGQVCQRLEPLNGSNTYNFTLSKWDYTYPRTQVEPTFSPIHPKDFGPGRKAVETIHLFGDGLWAKG